MAHDLAIKSDGTHAFAYVGDKAWHGLGQELTKDSSIEEWKKQAGFDFEIKQTPVCFNTDAGIITSPDSNVLYRGDTNAQLAVVGNTYKLVQPAAVLEFFADLVDGTGMYLETAGVLAGGRRFWAMANTTKSQYIGNAQDITKGYLMLATSADGTCATVAQFQSVRVVCNNTLRIAMKEKTNRVRVTHRSNFNPEMVKSNLGIYGDAWEQYIEKANKLASKQLSDATAKEMIDSLILSNPNDPANSTTQSVNTADFIMDLYKTSGMGASLQYGNTFGVLNAVTEYVDHHARTGSPENRFWGQFFGSGDKLKQGAFNLLYAYA